MSELVKQIKKDRMSAKKSGNKGVSTLLTTLLGELETNAKRTGKDIDDVTVVQTCKKFISGNKETMSLTYDQSFVDALQTENEVLESYLPVQMTGLEIEKAIGKSGATNMKEAFQFLSKNYSGRYDGKEASAVAKRMFA